MALTAGLHSKKSERPLLATTMHVHIVIVIVIVRQVGTNGERAP